MSNEALGVEVGYGFYPRRCLARENRVLYYAYSESTINPYLEDNSLPLKRRNWSNLAPEMLKHIVSDIEEECMNITQDHASKEALFRCINVARRSFNFPKRIFSKKFAEKAGMAPASLKASAYKSFFGYYRSLDVANQQVLFNKSFPSLQDEIIARHDGKSSYS